MSQTTMPMVTGFLPDRSRRGRVLIIGESGPIASVQRRALKSLGLREGADIDAERLAVRIGEAEKEAAHAVALDLLSKQDYSVTEVRRRLAARGFPEDAALAECSRLVKAGLLDDKRLARHYVDARQSARPAGKRLLRAELARRGLDRNAIQEALAAAPVGGSVEELELADRAAEERLRRRPVTDDREVLQREHRLLVDFLLRRGFGSDTAERAARKALRLRGFDPDKRSD
ncbi:MAG: regulatory protein RecX [Bacillota bacterium]